MHRILIVNLTRMGDIIQTGPLITGLRRRYPRARIGLLTLKAFGGVAALLPGVDERLVFDQDAAVGLLLDPDRELGARTLMMRRIIRELRGEGWDLVINVTHSRDSAVLAHLLSRGEVRGIHIHANGRTRVEHDWARYFFCVTGNRAVNPFNLVDIYRRIGDLAPNEGERLALEVGPEAVARAAELTAPLLTGGHRRPLILIQPGASRENRRWPVTRLVAAMREIHDSADAVFAIAGAKGEAALADEVLAAATGIPCLSLAGRTSIEELAAVCSLAALLITNDTGTLHVAAARGVPSVSLFFATALPWETGPWLPGSLMIQVEMECAPCSHHVSCPHVMCRERIHPGMVAAAAQELLRRQGWLVRPIPGWENREGARVWETLHDAAGLQDLKLLGTRRLFVEDIMSRTYRRMWQEQLGAPLAGLAAFEEEFAFWCAGWSLPDNPVELIRLLEEAGHDLALLRDMAGSGLVWVARAHQVQAAEPVRATLLEDCIRAIVALDERIFAFELSRPLLRPLGVLFRFEKEELREEDSLERLERETARIYSELRRRAMRLEELTDDARRTLEALAMNVPRPFARVQPLAPVGIAMAPVPGETQ